MKLLVYNDTAPDADKRTPFDIFYGTTVPLDTDGSDGNIYIRYSNASETFYKKVSGKWQLLGRPRVRELVTTISLTADVDTEDIIDISSLSVNMVILAPTGTPHNFQKLTIRICDNGTAHTLTWNGAFADYEYLLPLTTTASKSMLLEFVYNTANSLNKWQLIGSSLEA